MVVASKEKFLRFNLPLVGHSIASHTPPCSGRVTHAVVSQALTRPCLRSFPRTLSHWNLLGQHGTEGQKVEQCKPECRQTELRGRVHGVRPAGGSDDEGDDGDAEGDSRRRW